jgi:hypothetical protein
MEIWSVCLPSDLECGSQHLTSTMNLDQVILISGSSDSSPDFHKMNSSGVAVKSVLFSTLDSQRFLIDAKDKLLNVNFSEKGKQHRPWWKVFLHLLEH